MSTREKTFFHAGEVVKLKQEIPNTPLMIVKSVPKTRRIGENSKPDTRSILLGVRCFWFTDTGLYQEQIFNSKDLDQC